MAPTRPLAQPGRAALVAACSLSLLATGATVAVAGGAPDAAARAVPSGLAATTATTTSATTTGATPDRPNVLMITTDDMSADELRRMPHVQRLLVDRGATFSSAVAPTPLCVPARASLLTGQYAHNHGARGTSGPKGGVAALHDRRTLPVWLQRAGYDTLFAGKYLNGYGYTKTRGHGPRSVPPGWDEWHATVGVSTYDYTRPRVNHNGRVTAHRRYTTTLFGDLTTRLLTRPERTAKPWFMWTNFVAPHSGGPRDTADPRGLTRTPSPARQDRRSFRGAKVPAKPSLFTAARGSRLPTAKDSPRWRSAMHELHRQRLQALQSVDRGVGKVVAGLRRTGQLDRTVIVFSSDNGYSKGYHRKDGKVLPWDEILRVPLVIAGPGVPHRTVRTTVTNPDLATTIATLAGARPTVAQDGVDVWPLLRSRQRDRVVPIAAWRLADGRQRIYRGVRTDRWTYVRLAGGREELYDRRLDRFETENVAGTGRYAAALRQLRRLDQRYAACRGTACPRVRAAPGQDLVPGPRRG